MLNWIGWNGTDFNIEIVLSLNRIVWNRTVFPKTILVLNRIVSVIIVWINGIAWNSNVFDN